MWVAFSANALTDRQSLPPMLTRLRKWHSAVHGVGKASRPLFLIWDGCRAHATAEVKKVAGDENIVLITLPPHTTLYLQLHDVFYFSRFWAGYKYLFQHDPDAFHPLNQAGRRELVCVLVGLAARGVLLNPGGFCANAAMRRLGILRLHDGERLGYPTLPTLSRLGERELEGMLAVAQERYRQHGTWEGCIQAADIQHAVELPPPPPHHRRTPPSRARAQFTPSSRRRRRAFSRLLG